MASTKASTFIGVAERVLAHANRPMTAREIVRSGSDQGWLKTRGKTPWKTMNARLSTDILKNREKSLFMRADSGLLSLRTWSDQIQEFTAPRRTIALFDEDILVFDKKLLHQFTPTTGLTSPHKSAASLLSHCYSMRRQEAEERFDVIQLVSVYIVRFKDKILTYKRSKRLPEKRLNHVYSAFFGGHLNDNDVLPLFSFDSKQQLDYLAERELNEELKMPQSPSSIRFRGLLYDPRTEVSKQHIGVVFVVKMSSPEFEIGERGFLLDPRFETKTRIRKRLSEFENWSEVLVNERL